MVRTLYTHGADLPRMSWQDKIRNPNCTACPLHENAQYVCLMGTGPKKARLMIVGEAPGEREDEEHAAFVGPAGQLLTELLEEAGIKREDCYITNAVKCRPEGNATPGRRDVKECAGYLRREYDKTQPEVVLGLGNTALQALTGRSGITKHRGKLERFGEGRVLCTFHPAAALRSNRYLDPIRADLARVHRLLQGGTRKSLNTRTTLVRSRDQLAILLRLLDAAPEIAFDLETTGLHEWEEGARIVTLGVSWEPGKAAVIPLNHAEVIKPPGNLLHLKRVLEDPTKKYIAHNGKFDCKWLAACGIYVPVTFDTMIAAHLLDENRAKGLKPLTQMLLGADDWDVDVKDAYNQNLKRLAIYNGKDCDYTLRLYHLLREQLRKQPRVARVFKKLMMPASDIFTRLEMGGTYVDPERLATRTDEAEQIIAKLERYMDKFLPKGVETINYNSPAQVSLWLFDHLKLPILERTKTDAPSTAEPVLLRLAKEHNAVRALLKYRKWAKYLSTYLRPFNERRDHKSRIHPSYRLTGTVTGRLSSSEPNLQQVPRDSFIRGIIGASNGWRLVEADYSQIELRIAAWMAGERRMLAALREGYDLHNITACAILQKQPQQITKDERVIWGKHPNFGLLFGMYPKKYVEYCRDNGALEISLAEAEDVYDTFHRAYPALRRWHARQVRLAHRYQRVSNPIGRVRHLPDVRNSNDSIRMEAERQAINSPVQGFASDLMLFAAVRLAGQLNPRHARLVGSVHDSLLFEVTEDAVAETAATIRSTMEDTAELKRVFGVNLDVPIVVEIEAGTHWSEGKIVE